MPTSVDPCDSSDAGGKGSFERGKGGCDIVQSWCALQIHTAKETLAMRYGLDPQQEERLCRCGE